MLYRHNIGIIIDVLNIVVILFSPGNQLRKQAEMMNRFLEFDDFSFIDKVYLGIVHTFKILVIQQNAIFLFLCIVLAIMSVNYLKEIYKKIIGIMPMASILIIKTILPKYKIKNMKSINYHMIGTYLPLCIAVVMLMAITISIVYLLYDKDYSNKWYLPIVLLCGGLATQVAMGFSPTIYASGNRQLRLCTFR